MVKFHNGRKYSNYKYNIVLMSYPKFNIQKSQINELIKISGQQKLPQLDQYHETLQVQLPNIFAGKPEKNIHHEKIEKIQEQQIPRKEKVKIKKTYFKMDDGSNQKFVQPKITFYSIVKMLFPEPYALNSLVINIMDTIFYNQDGSMTYVYSDPKKGLIKTKAKNYIEIFFKRKAQVEMNTSYFQKTGRKSSGNFQQLCHNLLEQREEFLKNLDYVALLRYKDQNFIRLKEHEFKSLFIRPVQANQKYKICNNTHYIQLIPQQVNYKQGTIFPIEFILQKHINTNIFKKAVDKHCQETSYNKCRVSDTIKNQIKQISTQAFLLYIIFEIYAYINIHYHKQITYGIFQFMKVHDTFYLSNARKIKLSQSENIKNQYAYQDLFEEFVEEESNFILPKERYSTGVLRTINQLFSHQNQKISQNIRSFIKKKIDQIEDRDDNVSSNQIFSSINQKQNRNLHELLDNQEQYQKFIKKKQQELDGFSPLTSISNICRKKYIKNSIPLSKKENTIIKNIETKDKNNKNCFSFIQQREDRTCPWSKWFKQSLNRKKQFYQQKK